jgi:PAS domain S-box-containing protein
MMTAVAEYMDPNETVGSSWFESLLIHISTRFLRLPADQVDSVIEETQRLLCSRLGLDRSSLWQVSGEDGKSIELTHFYQAPGGVRLQNAPEAGLLKDPAWVIRHKGPPAVYARMDATKYFPWIVAQNRNGRTVVISSPDDFPPEAAFDRDMFQRYGASSTVAVPLRLGGRWLGTIAFAAIARPRQWSAELVRRFELIAHLFSHALGRKWDARDLRENEARLRAILNTASEAIITINEQGLIDSANLGAERIFGYSAAELAGSNVSLIMPSPFSRQHDRHLAAYLKGGSSRVLGRSVESLGQRKDGSVFPIELTVSELKLDDRRLFTGFVRDISVRKQAEEALRQSERRFRIIADSAPVLIWMTGEDHACTFVNRPWLAFTGRQRDAEIVPAWPVDIHPDDRQEFLSRFHEAADTRQPFVAHFRLRRHDGAYRWLVTSGVAYFDARGQFGGYVGSCTDITEQKEAEKAARDLSGLLIKSQEEHRARLARELHDDITQRLARLSIDVGRFTQRVSLQKPEDELIRGVGEGLVRLCQDVHALSYELHPSVLIDLGLEAALRSECEQVARRQSIDAELTVRDLPPAIPREIAVGLFRIAQEGLRNAIRHGRASRVEISLAGVDFGLSLVVHDNGIGFDISRRRNAPSLGLSSMRERARLLSGDLDIESEPGQGTTIVTWIPL